VPSRVIVSRHFPRAVSLLLILLMMLSSAPVASGQSLGETLQQCPGTITGNTAPEQVHLQMGSDHSEMVAMWATEQRRGSAFVQWGATDTAENENEGESYCYNHDMAFHMAIMQGLEAATEYKYRVGDGNMWSEDFTFTTIDPDAEHFEWIAIADHSVSDEALAVSDAIIADGNAQMVTISGDISYANGEQSVWDEWFNVQAPSMQSVPWVTAVGNHEEEEGYGFAAYEHRFDANGVAEGEPFWYGRNLPGISLIVMSTEHDYSMSSAQFSALDADLAAANSVDARAQRPFIVVIGHKPMYSSNAYHGSEVELRDALEELYVEHGVDLVIAGHDHFYERTWPVANETAMDRGVDDGTRFGRGIAPIHIVAGVAGRAAYEELVEPQPDWSAYRENNTYGWMRLVYDGDSRELDFTYHRIDGTIGDHFIISEKSVVIDEDDGFLGIPGFGTLLPILAMFGAAVCRLR
jgi:hypothetical protein